MGCIQLRNESRNKSCRKSPLDRFPVYCRHADLPSRADWLIAEAPRSWVFAGGGQTAWLLPAERTMHSVIGGPGTK
jgi:hypothetical protein